MRREAGARAACGQWVRRVPQVLAEAGHPLTPRQLSIRIGMTNRSRWGQGINTLLQRLCRQGVVVRLTRGVYALPAKDTTCTIYTSADTLRRSQGRGRVSGIRKPAPLLN